MARIKKYAPEQKLSSYQTFIVDENPNSDYFRITEFKDTFTGGKNGFLIEGSEYLKESTEIKIDILDVNGNPIYYEPGNGIPEYYEGISKLIAVYIYEDTPIGLGKITVLGELKEYDDNGVKRTIPENWKGAYNVKWEKTFQINKNLANEDRVRFYRRPVVNITEINKPIFNNNSTVLTKSGSANGIPLVPIANTNLSNFTLPTSYRITTADDNFWTGSIAGQTITFGDINYSAKIDEVVSDTEIVVSPPYTQTNLVKPFTNKDYSVSFNYLEGVTDLATALTGSFAKINITDMKTFVGDAARVKVFRRSQSNLTDYEFVQEIQLESNELLRDIETTIANEENYGTFTEDILSQYWITSSNDFTTEFNRSFLYNSAKLNSTTGNYFITSQSFSVQSGVEYTLDFNVKKGSTNGTHFLKAFLSGSLNGTAKSQTIVNIPSSNAILQKQNFSENIVADGFDSAKLYFEVEGDDWYINNVSLKASQETSFSPDEITFIQQVPKTLQTETFDYRFEFYDINNNYIPVLVEETKTFDGGNLNLFNKSITITPNQLYFTFDSASNPSNPLPPYTIVFDIETSVVTGSVNFTSGAYDEFGDYISASEYIGGQYPGLLYDRETGTPTLHVSDFTGSRDDIFVQYIRFTGEVEGVSDSVVISRVQDGKGGVNFEIRPYRGTIIKNKSDKDLEVQAIRIDGVNEIVLRDGLPQIGFSDAKLRILTSSVDPFTSEISSSYLLLSEATAWGVIQGVTAGTTGSGEIDYNAVFNRDSIDSELTLYLMDGHTSESILTSLILTDLQDGLDGGYISFDAEQFGIKPRTEREFTPNIGRVTGSFYLRGTNENPISGTLDIYPSMSVDIETIEPTYYMFYVTNSFDRRISVEVTDFDNNIINSGIPGQNGIPFYEAIPTKQLNTKFTYTEDITSSSISTDKTFFAVPDGNPGDDAILVKIDPNPIVLNADQRGRVFNYDKANTEVTVTQGVLPLIFTGSKKPGTFTTASIITTGIEFSTFDEVGGDASMSLSGFSNMNDLTASIEYVLEIHPFFTASFFTQSYFQPVVKSLDGAAAINIELEPTVVSIVTEENGGAYNYSSANTTLKVKQGDEYLEYNSLEIPGTFTASFATANISVGLVTSSKTETTENDLHDTLNFVSMSNMTSDSASIDYNITIRPFSITNGIVTGSQSIVRRQLFTKQKEGVKARSVSLETTSQTVNFDGDGVVTSPIGSIFLTATPFNVTGSQTYYQFFQDGYAYSTIDVDNTFEIGSGDATSPGNIATWKVEIRDGAADSPVVASAEVTITGIKSGANNYQVFLTNPSPTVRVDVDGTTNYTQTGTQIKAFKGTEELTHVTNYSSPTLDLVGDPIGVLGEFSASIWSKDTYITQPNYPVGNPATVAPFTFWSNPQDNVSATIVYKVDIEDGRATYFLSQSISTVFEGQTGPGVVFRGPWTGSIEYIYNKDSKRRDAVLWSENGSEPYDTYYATKDSGSSYLVPSGSAFAPTIGGSLNDLYWESLGQEEFFVAAKIAIFEESFVKNTINVGQPSTAYAVNPQITIFGGSSEPYIAIGQGTQGYGFQGIFMGVTEDGGPNGTSGTSGLLSLEDDTGQSYLRWDGYNLEVKSDNVLIETTNLTIDSQNELISIGQGTQGFGNEGVFIGQDGVDSKLSLRGTPSGTNFNALEWDGSTLTLRGALRQTSAGVIEPSLRGTWASGTTYYPQDLVQYLGETWSSNTQHTSTNDTNASTGVPGSGPWVIAAGAGKGVTLLADTYVIAYDAYGNNPTPSGTLNLIASSSNFVNGFYKFTGGGATFTDETSFTNGLTANTDTAAVTIPTTYFSTPLTFKVAVAEGDQVEKVSDTITIVAVQPGADSTPMYFITPIAGGTQLKNSSGTIELQVQKSDSTGLTDITSGTDARIYDGATLLAAQTGVTDGGNGVAYNPIIAPSFITGTKTLTLKDNSGNVLDTITLVDVTDGLGGGSFISPNLKSTRNPADNSFTPTLLHATASFFDTSGTEYQGRVTITPSFSGGVDRMAVSTKVGDTEVVITAGDGDGGVVTLGGASVPTKDIVLTAVFTDPATSQTTTINETFYIISDGLDGLDAITVINTNQAHTLPSSDSGVVSSFTNSGTIIKVFEGITPLDYVTGTPASGEYNITATQNPTSIVSTPSISGNGTDTATVADFTSMNSGTDSVTISYSISGKRTNGEVFTSETTQTLTKAKAGSAGAGAFNTRLSADNFVIAYDSTGANPTPSSISLIASSSNFSNGYFKFTGGGAAFTDETTFTDGLTANTDTATFTAPSSYASTPYTFRVAVADGDQAELASDVITVSSVKPGGDTSPLYFITSIAGGTQLKNSSGTIELQVQKSSVSGLSDVTSGTDARIYDGATLLAAQTGVTNGGNGVEYNPIIAPSFINGTKTLTLKDGSLNVLDTITLVDVTDGLGGGSFLSPNLKTTRNPVDNTFAPTFLSATASFFDTSGTEYTKQVRITPSFSSVDYMAVGAASGDSEITITANDGDGGTITLGGAAVATKDTVLIATFTDPATSQTTTITETFYIISDGADGLDAITVISTNQAHTLPADSAGTVSSYAGSGTTISVYEGITQLDYDGSGTSNSTWTVSATPTNISAGGISDSGNNAVVADHSGMSATQASVTYNISGKRSNGDAFTAQTIQTLTKAVSGTNGVNGTSGVNGTNGAAGTPSGIVYAGAWTLLLPDGSTPDTTDKVAYLAEETLKYVVKYTSGGSNYWVCATTHRYTGPVVSAAGWVVDDIALESGTYYICTNDTADEPSVDPPSWTAIGSSIAPGTWTGGWTSFGAEFTSVATDILFAQDVYADKTINVGTKGGTTPVIALNSDADNSNANPFISIGQTTQGFRQNGIYLGYDAGSPVLSFVTSSAGVQSYFIYESGSITLSDANFTGTGSIIEGSEIRVGETSPGSNSYNFRVDTLGNLFANSGSFRGTIDATGGNIGAWDITSDYLASTAGNITFDAVEESIIVTDTGGNVRFNANTETSLPSLGGAAATQTSNISTTNLSVLQSMAGVQSGTVYRSGASAFTAALSDKHRLQYSYSGGTASWVSATGQGASGNLSFTLQLTTSGTGGAGTVVASSTTLTKYASGYDIYGSVSVAGDTKITLSDGSIKLAKDILTTDLILAWDEINNQYSTASISEILTRKVEKFFRVKVGDKIVDVSDSHGFWIDGGWLIKVQDIIVGETEIYIKDGNDKKFQVVDSVEEIYKEIDVYTFRVPEFANYVSNDIISHNPIGYTPMTDIEYIPTTTFTATATLTSGNSYYAHMKIQYGLSVYVNEIGYEAEIDVDLNSGPATLSPLTAGTIVNGGGFQAVVSSTAYFRVVSNDAKQFGSSIGYYTDLRGGIAVDAVYGAGGFSPVTGVGGAWNVAGHPYLIKGAAIITFTDAAETTHGSGTVRLSAGNFTSITGTTQGIYNINITSVTANAANTSGKYASLIATGRAAAGGGGIGEAAMLGVESQAPSSGTGQLTVWNGKPNASILRNLQSLQLLILH